MDIDKELKHILEEFNARCLDAYMSGGAACAEVSKDVVKYTADKIKDTFLSPSDRVGGTDADVEEFMKEMKDSNWF